MSSPLARSILVAGLSLLLSGCALGRLGGPQDPSRVPDGAPKPQGVEAVGPVTVLGEGVSRGIGWRYSVFESVDGWCTHVEMGDGSGSIGCGGLLPEPEDGFGAVGSNGELFEGVVSTDVTEVALQATDGRMLRATLMSMEPVGVDAHAFVVGVPHEGDAASLLALDEGGEVVERFDVSGMVLPSQEPGRPPDQPPETTSSAS